MPHADAIRASWTSGGPPLGEFALIERLRTILPGDRAGVALGIGDDTAVLHPGGPVLATCDAQVEGVHFTRDTCTPADAGWRALAVNLSDIAAMGGTPRHALVSLLIPAATGAGVLEAVYEGLAALARQHGVAVVGGNISSTPGPLAIDVTVLGEAGHPVLRRGARPGDGVWLTGRAGKAAAGRFLLEHRGVLVPDREALEQAYRRPVPRLTAGRALAALARTGVVTAMIDTSDGTASDLLHLAEASGVGVRLDAGRVPAPRGLAEAARAAGVPPETWTLGGGEDYELLFTATKTFEARVRDAAAAGAVEITRIGAVVPERDGRSVATHTGARPLRPDGWDHLAPRDAGRRGYVEGGGWRSRER